MDNLELLERLGEIEPPMLEVTDRVIAALQGAVAVEERKPAVMADTSQRPHRRRVKRGSSRARTAAIGAGLLVVAAIALVAALVVPSSSEHGVVISPRGTAVGSGGFELVDATSFPFSTVGGGVDPITLDCATTTVCYATENGGPPSSAAVLEKTVDGGRTWQATAPVPGGSVNAFESTSCVTADICAFVGSPGESGPVIVQTIDGGATWSTITVPLPQVSGASIGPVSCVDALRCVVSAGTTSSGTLFLSTDDGGATWSTAASLPALTSNGPWTLRCDPDGACIAVVVSGSVAPGAGGVALSVLRSSDLGKSWTDVPAPQSVQPGPGILLASCGDALHCFAAYSSPTPGEQGFVLAATADGGTTWTTTTAPASWPDVAIALDCSSGSDCWVSVSDVAYRTLPATPASATTTTPAGNTGSGSQPSAVVGVGYKNPVIEQTTDGGETWTALGVPPTANGAPMAVVGPLSCVSGAGCVGIGATEVAFDPPHAPLSQVVSALANSRVVLSNLANATRGNSGQ
jgi:photosystem II stability/assembly factor-like uncharacterized protein